MLHQKEKFLFLVLWGLLPFICEAAEPLDLYVARLQLEIKKSQSVSLYDSKKKEVVHLRGKESQVAREHYLSLFQKREKSCVIVVIRKGKIWSSRQTFYIWGNEESFRTHDGIEMKYPILSLISKLEKLDPSIASHLKARREKRQHTE